MRSCKNLRDNITIKDMLGQDGKIKCKICERKISYGGGGLTCHLKLTHNIDIEKYIIDSYYNGIKPTCLCGCNEEVLWQVRGGFFQGYINGHNYRGKTKESCESVRVRTEKSMKTEGMKKNWFNTGEEPWNKGLSPEDDNRVKRMVVGILRYVNTIRGQTKNTNLSLLKVSKTLKKLYSLGLKKPSITPKHKRKESAKKRLKTINEKINNGTFAFKTPGYKQGYYISKSGERNYYNSGWELKRMEFYDMSDNIVSWNKVKDIVPYFHTRDNKDRSYYPDFEVEYSDGVVIVEEVKGRFDQEVVDKAIAAIEYFKETGRLYNVITLNERKNEWKKLTLEDLYELVK